MLAFRSIRALTVAPIRAFSTNFEDTLKSRGHGEETAYFNKKDKDALALLLKKIDSHVADEDKVPQVY
jgi:hypothetical protein